MIKLITRNRSYQPLAPRGIVIHETATPGATADNEYNYFNSGNRGASAHAFVDWNGFIQTVPYTEVAWHAGPTANSRYIGIEMCRPSGFDREKFSLVWEGTVRLVSELCREFGISEIISHSEISLRWGETDHTDPVGYFAEYGKTMEDFRSAVENTLKGDELSMTQYEELNAKISKINEHLGEYNYIDENLPSWATPTVRKLADKGFLKGDEEGLGLTFDMLRILVVLDRAGVFD